MAHCFSFQWCRIDWIVEIGDIIKFKTFVYHPQLHLDNFANVWCKITSLLRKEPFQMINIHYLYSPLTPATLFASLLGTDSEISEDNNVMSTQSSTWIDPADMSSSTSSSTSSETSSTLPIPIAETLSGLDGDKKKCESSLCSPSLSIGKRLPRLPWEIVRKIFELIPSYETSLKRIVKEHFESVTVATSNKTPSVGSSSSSSSPSLGAIAAATRMKRKLSHGGAPHLQHAVSPMYYVDNVENASVYATVAHRSCRGCLNPSNCGSPYFELKLHLFLDGEFVPFTKAYSFDTFCIPLTHQRSVFSALKTWKHLIQRILQDLAMFPTFRHAGFIWYHLSNTVLSHWNCVCPELGVGVTVEDYCRQHPTWARDFMLHHYCGEMFFEEMLEKYVQHPCSFKPLAAVFGTEVANRLLMSATMLNPRKKMKSTLNYHDLEMHNSIYSSDGNSSNYSNSSSSSSDHELGVEEDDDVDDEIDDDGFDVIL